MIFKLYKNIIGKIDLTLEERQTLKQRLTEENVCAGPFIRGDKFCPITTALTIKFKDKDLKNENIKKLLHSFGVGNRELWVFYLAFDIPTYFSKGFFKRCLESMREIV